MRSSRQSAFTLLELLAVIAVIVVLGALLFPGIKKAINLGHQAKSTANLRAMGQGLMSYVNDNNGALIRGAINTGNMDYPFWFNYLGPYMQSPEEATAEGAARKKRPSWQNDPAKVFTDPPLYNNKACCGVGYGWNHAYFGYVPYLSGYGWGSKFAEVDKPAQTIIIGTSTDDPNAKDILQHVVLHAGGKTVRYGGRGLFLMLDGHVEALTPEETGANDKYLFKKKKPEM